MYTPPHTVSYVGIQHGGMVSTYVPVPVGLFNIVAFLLQISYWTRTKMKVQWPRDMANILVSLHFLFLSLLLLHTLLHIGHKIHVLCLKMWLMDFHVISSRCSSSLFPGVSPAHHCDESMNVLLFQYKGYLGHDLRWGSYSDV